jgi:polyribonucleotide nucleotidyltransferase
MIGAMAALALSPIPCQGTMAAVRLGWIDGNIIVNPTWSILEAEANHLDLIMSATDQAITMVEAGGRELPDSEVVKVLAAGHEVCREIVGMINELVKSCGRPKVVPVLVETDHATPAALRAKYGEASVRKLLLTQGKHERYAALADFVKKCVTENAPEGVEEAAVKAQAKVKAGAEALLNDVERIMTLDGQRVDGRDTKTVRPISIEAGLLPRTHGSTLFTRGETQAIVTATLGSADDEQFLDGLRAQRRKNRFMLHYNFPPFSTGEAKPLRGTSRRETGHGALAERALRGVLPKYEDFAYTIRIVSEITESNGSSSMASVCGGCLAMMDAGVPITAPVAGIAMGLIVEGDKWTVLTDILGSEDHHGDMDFKVAGTRKGITALQMDIKVQGLKPEIMEAALAQARAGRLHILDKMGEALAAPRTQLSPYAPINKSITISPEKIGFLIGPKGANIRELQETYGVTVSVVGDDGVIQVSGIPAEKVEACIERIRQQTRVIQSGERFKAKVTSIKDFGCFVDLGGGQEGMCHISELDLGRVETVEHVCKLGDEIDVVVVEVDERTGKIRVSRRVALLPEDQRAAAIDGARKPARGRGGPGGPGGGRGGRDRGDRGDRGYDRPRYGEGGGHGDREGGRERAPRREHVE